MNISTENYKLFNGDCLEIMDKLIAQGIQVDCILTDPPYGTTRCKWDSVIPLDEMWERLNKLIKPNGVIALFSNQPFTSKLVCSNIKNFKYDWYWIKEKGKGHLSAKKQPLRNVEIISIFYKKQCLYNPQFSEGKPYQRLNCNNQKTNKGIYNIASNETFNTVNTSGKRYPKNALNFTSVQRTVHPTQKPVDLLEYLIKTYTNENELVLDFTMGSGSTGVACMNINRKFIGIELDKNYFNISINRIFEDYSNK